MYIELFILDNALMNILILRLAASICAFKTSHLRFITAALLGAFYAAAALAFLPELLDWHFKILLGGVMTLAVWDGRWKTLPKTAIALYAATFLIGGAMWALMGLAGGSMKAGIFYAPVPVRLVLIVAVIAALLPRVIRNWIRERALSRRFTKIKITHNSKEYDFQALIDTGNDLFEPLTGLPAVVAYAPELAEYAWMPVPYETVGGGGFLQAFKPDKIEVLNQDQWISINAVAAISKSPISNADALLGTSALPLQL